MDRRARTPDGRGRRDSDSEALSGKSSALELFPPSPYFNGASYDDDDNNDEETVSLASVSTAPSEELRHQTRSWNYESESFGGHLANPAYGAAGASTPPSARPPPPSPAPSSAASSSLVVLDVGSPENAFRVQTRTESAEFVNFCADRIETQRRKKKRMDHKPTKSLSSKSLLSNASGAGAVHDLHNVEASAMATYEASGDDLSPRKPPPSSPCYDRRIKILCCVLAALVVLAVIAVPVALVLKKEKGATESPGGTSAANATAAAGAHQTDPDKPWSSESFGGRLAVSNSTDPTLAGEESPSFKAKVDEETLALAAREGEGNGTKESAGPSMEQETAAVPLVDEPSAAADAANESSEADPLPVEAEAEATAAELPEKDLGRHPRWLECLDAPSECVTLDLHGLDLIGRIPESIGRLTSLRKLDLSGNLLTGPIPDAIGELSQLEIFSLDNNELDGEIPSSMGRLNDLYDMRLHNNVSGAPSPPPATMDPPD